jgi:hypothetical protein
MPGRRSIFHGWCGVLALLLAAAPAAAEVPSWLPRYDLDIHLDVEEHWVHVREIVTWTNKSERPATELVFNAHSHYQVASEEIGFMAKMLELLRMTPSDAIDPEAQGGPLQMKRVTLGGTELSFHYAEPIYPGVQKVEHRPAELQEHCLEDHATTLVIPLPKPVARGEAVTVELDFDFRLPQKQGRWGQWKGVTTLSNWLPVVAVYDEVGWQPTPFIPWHQPFFNEAGIYCARLILPCDQKIACTAAVRASKDLGDGTQQVDFHPICVRDFALLCSACYEEHLGQAGSVQIRCLALPGHEHFAREMIRWVGEALPAYNQWFGPYPYPQFTIAESFFGWNGNECGGLVMIDERVFSMPHLGGAYVEYLISHEFCHQWWYNAIGTNGYCETWMDEAMATHFSHRLMTQKHGRHSTLLQYPSGLEWLPNIDRDTYRQYSMYGALGRGEMKPAVQKMEEYGHLPNLFSACYDRGSKVVGMIEERMGEIAFFDFLHIIYARYQFRILRVADFQRELEQYTGLPWGEFFDNWLYGAGMSDWCVEKVHVRPVKPVGNGALPAACSGRETASDKTSPVTTRCSPVAARQSYEVAVLLRQKAEVNESTVLGICLDGGDGYHIRIPIEPGVRLMELDDPPVRVEALADNCVRVQMVLPCKPTQISVDPDHVLLDRNPANNHWKPMVRVRFSPIYTLLDETDLTNAYDRWNFIFGPALFGPSYTDPWYTRSTVVGLRAGLYRTQEFSGGAYLGYRTDDRDLVAGVEGLWDHWPWPRTQVGFNVERSLTTFGNADDAHADRAVLFGRYVFQYSSSLYLPPMHYAEAFTMLLDHNLPTPRQTVPGADPFTQQNGFGVHYHIDYLTPYWDPEGGFRFDATYTTGVPVFGEHEAFNRVDAQFSTVRSLPEWLGPLSETRLAWRLYGAAALPNDGEFYPLGGGSLFRGFDLQQRQGSMVWVGSVEWRVPIFRNVQWDACDHVAGVRNVYVAPFYDVGNAYLRGHEIGPIAHALGAGLRVDVAWFGFIERTTLRFDLAKTVNADTPWQFWFGVQHPF